MPSNLKDFINLKGFIKGFVNPNGFIKDFINLKGFIKGFIKDFINLKRLYNSKNKKLFVNNCTRYDAK